MSNVIEAIKKRSSTRGYTAEALTVPTNGVRLTPGSRWKIWHWPRKTWALAI